MALGDLLVVFSLLSSSVSGSMYMLSLLGIAIFILGFEVGPGPIFQVLVSELYPAAVRGRAMSVVVTVNWIACITLVFIYLPLVQLISELAMFFFFFALCAGTAAFVYFVVPETKGKTLDEIEAQSQRS
jgi:hypothetical protein